MRAAALEGQVSQRSPERTCLPFFVPSPDCPTADGFSRCSLTKHVEYVERNNRIMFKYLSFRASARGCTHPPQEKYDEAMPLYERGHAICRSALGNQHVFTEFFSKAIEGVRNKQVCGPRSRISFSSLGVDRAIIVVGE